MNVKKRLPSPQLHNVRLRETSTQSIVEFKPKGWVERSRMHDDEIPVHPEFPSLHRLLCGEVIPSATHRSRDAESSVQTLVYARMKPGRSCQFWYEVRSEHEGGTDAPSCIVGCKVFSTKYSARRIQRIADQIANSADCELVSNENALLTRFPHDVNIADLPNLTNQIAMKRILATSMPNRIGTFTERLTLQVVSYRPERNCLFRCALHGQDGELRHAFGRMHADESEASRVFETTNTIFVRSNSNRAALNIPEPLGFDRDSKTFFHAAVDGVTLTSMLDQPAFVQSVERTAFALADLHSIDGTCGTAEHHGIAGLNSMAVWLGFGHPALGRRLSNAIASLTQYQFDAIGNRLVHGDFSSNQVLVDRERITIIDWNSARIGEPHQDIASFRTRLHRYLPESTANDLGDRFVKCYLHRRPNSVDPNRLVWFEACNQIREAAAAVKKLKTGWLQRIEFWIERAETSIQRLASTAG